MAGWARWDAFDEDHFDQRRPAKKRRVDAEDERGDASQPSPPPTGARRFTPGRILGEGTYGWVYACADTAAGGAAVACKVLNMAAVRRMGRHGEERDCSAARAHRLVLREIAVLKVLNTAEGGGSGVTTTQVDGTSATRSVYAEPAGTPAGAHHVIPLYDVVTNTKLTPILVFPRLDTDLHRVVQREGKLPRDAVAALAHALITAVAYVHAHGVLHRDIVPRNVLLDAGGGVYLTDFGVARFMNYTPLGQPAFSTSPASTAGASSDGDPTRNATGSTIECGRDQDADVSDEAATAADAHADGQKPSADDALEPLSPAAHRTATPYQAPECLLGAAAYGFPSDVWTLGATLAEAHLGRHLLQHTSQIPAVSEMLDLVGWPPAPGEWPGHHDLQIFSILEFDPRDPTLPALLDGAPSAVPRMLMRSPAQRPSAAALLAGCAASQRHPQHVAALAEVVRNALAA